MLGGLVEEGDDDDAAHGGRERRFRHGHSTRAAAAGRALGTGPPVASCAAT